MQAVVSLFNNNSATSPSIVDAQDSFFALAEESAGLVDILGSHQDLPPSVQSCFRMLHRNIAEMRTHVNTLRTAIR